MAGPTDVGDHLVDQEVSRRHAGTAVYRCLHCGATGKGVGEIEAVPCRSDRTTSSP